MKKPFLQPFGWPLVMKRQFCCLLLVIYYAIGADPLLAGQSNPEFETLKEISDGHLIVTKKHHGEVIKIERYKNDELDGEQNFFNERGYLKSVKTFQNGQLHGRSFSRYENGEMMHEENYENDELVGARKSYYENGYLYLDENYVDGKLDGEQALYGPNGNIIKKGLYDKGVEVGKHVGSIRPDGKVTYEAYYKNGKIRRETRYEYGVGSEYDVLQWTIDRLEDEKGKVLKETRVDELAKTQPQTKKVLI